MNFFVRLARRAISRQLNICDENLAILSDLPTENLNYLSSVAGQIWLAGIQQSKDCIVEIVPQKVLIHTDENSKSINAEEIKQLIQTELKVRI